MLTSESSDIFLMYLFLHCIASINNSTDAGSDDITIADIVKFTSEITSLFVSIFDAGDIKNFTIAANHEVSIEFPNNRLILISSTFALIQPLRLAKSMV